jgi:heterodisulfide reductase subunit A-like polyferredoxin
MSQSEKLEAQAELDLCYYFLENLMVKKSERDKRHPLVKAIDVATGFDKEEEKEEAETGIELFKRIIAAKEVLGYETETTKESLATFKKLTNHIINPIK